MKLSYSVDSNNATQFLIDLEGLIVDRRELHQVLSERLAEDLQDHFRGKNQKPNRLGGPRTNFWADVANSTTVGSVSDSSGEVVIGGDPGQRVRIHIFGGTIVPKAAGALTIPLIAEAHGLRVREYSQRFRKRLFTIPGRNVLFERSDGGGSESIINRETGRGRTRSGRATTVRLRARQELRAVYALSKGVTIQADPTALPTPDVMLQGLTEETNDYLATKGLI